MSEAPRAKRHYTRRSEAELLENAVDDFMDYKVQTERRGVTSTADHDEEQMQKRLGYFRERHEKEKVSLYLLW